MKSRIAATCFIAVALLTPLVHAQSCPAGVTDPLQVLNGKTFTFHTEAGDFVPVGMASMGVFTATFVPAGADPKNPQPHGNLNGTAIFSDFAKVTRAQFTGRYTVETNCSGGSLMIMNNAQPVQYEFVFANGFTEMFLVSQSIVGNYVNPAATGVMTGRATLGGVTGCPAGLVDPLQLLDGVVWSFRTTAANFAVFGASVGFFKGTFVPAGTQPRNPFAHGDLSLNQSISFTFTSAGQLFPTVRQGQFSGRYLVNADCSGGTLFFNVNQQAVQYEFLFPSNLFDEMRLFSVGVSPTAIGGQGGSFAFYGNARKF